MNEKNAILFRTVRHFFPEFRAWLRQIKDPRFQNEITYPISVMTWVGILLFLFKMGARRQINFKLKTENMSKNINLLCKENVETMPNDKTLAVLLKYLDPAELEKFIYKMNERLLRMRSLEKFRQFGKYLVGGDGSRFLSFKEKHCDRCLYSEKDGEITDWHHSVAEVKLICGNGLVLSLGTEFVENADQNMKEGKQDCELNAFYRLTEKLKKCFPQLSICFLLDGLYANQRMFSICRENHWDYIITFKEGSMPGTFSEYISLKGLSPENSAKNSRPGIEQDYRWVNGISYEGHSLNVLECREVKTETDKAGKTTQVEKTFIWLASFEITRDNFERLANKGGRLRWKSENEGFNMQKNGGYNLEHAYCLNENAIKNFYLLLQIAHTINQLMELGSLLMGEVQKVFGSIRNFTDELLEAFRTSVLSAEEILAIESETIQIRIRSS